MKQNDNLIEELNEIRDTLARGSVELLDFDRLNGLLEGSREDIIDSVRREKELRELKESLRDRIAGMLKANLACRFKERDADLAVRLSDDPDAFTAGELISMYRRTSAAFRDNFPSTFKYISASDGRFSSDRSWSDYKI